MTVLAIAFMTFGVGFLLVAAIGLIRLPDPLQRMHSATKAGTLGTSLILLGILGAGDVAKPSTALLTILFLLMTLPIGAQLLGRAAYLSGAPSGETDQTDPLRAELQEAAAPASHAGVDGGSAPADDPTPTGNVPQRPPSDPARDSR